MGKIHRMASALADQIAAGEVVERPASVVKELVENALDAGASKVRVAIVGGGLGSIRVTDDGEGMSADDAQLSIVRHATSKIRCFEDLAELSSFGFRGEALPSIASVSRFRLTTRTQHDAGGVTVSVEGAQPAQVIPAASSVGTHVEVNDLFFNVPARRKFVKTVATEAGHVADVVRLAALLRPDVSFVFEKDGRVARELLRKASRRERALDAAQGEQLFTCQFQRGPLRVEAHLAGPERARAGMAHLDLLINGRAVKDARLAKAIAQAFGTRLESGRYPYGVVVIDLPPSAVDVNVHPQKAEVRFADPRALYEALRFGLETELATLFGSSTPVERPGIAAFPRRSTAPIEPPAELRPPPAARAPLHVTTSPPEAEVLAEDVDLFKSVQFYSRLRVVGRYARRFLLCEGGDGLYVLDLHACAERVLAQRLHAEPPAPRVIEPVVVEVSREGLARIEAAETELVGLGLDLRRSGASSLRLGSVPDTLQRDLDPRELLAALLPALHTASSPRTTALRLLACHGAYRGDEPLDTNTLQTLVSQLDAVSFALPCVHGRPSVQRLAHDELERRLGR